MKFSRNETVRFLDAHPKAGIRAGEEGVVVEVITEPEELCRVEYELDEYNRRVVEVPPDRLERAEQNGRE